MILNVIVQSSFISAEETTNNAEHAEHAEMETDSTRRRVAAAQAAKQKTRMMARSQDRSRFQFHRLNSRPAPPAARGESPLWLCDSVAD